MRSAAAWSAVSENRALATRIPSTPAARIVLSIGPRSASGSIQTASVDEASSHSSDSTSSSRSIRVARATMSSGTLLCGYWPSVSSGMRATSWTSPPLAGARSAGMSLGLATVATAPEAKVRPTRQAATPVIDKLRTAFTSLMPPCASQTMPCIGKIPRLSILDVSHVTRFTTLACADRRKRVASLDRQQVRSLDGVATSAHRV